MVEQIQRGQRSRESELLQLLIDNDPNYAVIGLRELGQIGDWPRRAEQLFGYASDQVSGSPVDALFLDDGGDEHRRFISDLVAGQRCSGQTVARAKNGSTFPIYLTSTPILDGGNDIRSIITVCCDPGLSSRSAAFVTDQVLADQVLADQRRILELIATDTPLAEVLTAICSLVERHDRDSICSILLLDRDTQRMRYGAGPSLPPSFMEATDSHSLKPPIGPCAITMASGQAMIVRDVQNDTRWSPLWRNVIASHDLHSCRTTPILASDETVSGALAVYCHESDPFRQSDQELIAIATRLASIAIERNQLVAEQQQSRAGFETLVNSAPAGTFLVDAELRIRLLNPKMQTAIENVDRAIGKDFVRIMHSLWDESVADQIVEHFRHTLQTGDSYHQPEFIATRRDLQEPVYYDWQIHRVLLPDGQYGVVCYFADIAHHVLARQSIADADRRKTEFLATLGHELRNPLTPIKAAVQLMQMNCVDPREYQELASVIDRQVSQMTGLIDELLDVSRISCGKITLQTSPCDLRSIVDQAIEATKPTLLESQQTFDLRQPDEPVMVCGDSHRLVQVVVNLLNNASKYTPAQGGIRLLVQRRHDQAIMEVCDTGIGLAGDQLQKVFEIFQQVDSSHQRGQRGLGIGLSLVKSLVELHHGDVTAHSDGPGKGSTFRVRLPILSQPEPSHPSCCGGSCEQLPAAPVRPLRILVVEDTDMIRLMMIRLLRRMGHQVAEAPEGQTGLEKALSFQPDVIFSDISMPVMTGHEFARRVRNTASLQHVTLIALSGFGQESDQKEALDSGFDTHLIKPVDAANLARVLQAVDSP